MIRRSSLRRTSKPDPEWAAVREAALRRDGGRCRYPECSTDAVDVHHLVRRSQGGTHDLDNLVSLCRTHHEQIHNNPRWAREQGLLRSGHGAD